jgi:hypothetical protein
MQAFALCLAPELVLKHVEGQLIILFGLVYSLQNTLFMWITWVDRFSGNANFFYFQTIVYQLFHSVLFIQLYGALGKERKKLKQLLKDCYRNQPLIEQVS